MIIFNKYAVNFSFFLFQKTPGGEEFVKVVNEVNFKILMVLIALFALLLYIIYLIIRMLRKKLRE
jgi:flagellar biogenesis protein FliO